MRLLSMILVAGMLFAGLGLGYVNSAENSAENAQATKTVAPVVKEDLSIKEVMAKVMKGGMLRKAMSGEASDEEKMEILDALIMLSESEAPQGDADEFKAMTQRVLSDYAKVLVGREGAGDALKASTNCKACHDKFKPE